MVLAAIIAVAMEFCAAWQPARDRRTLPLRLLRIWPRIVILGTLPGHFWPAPLRDRNWSPQLHIICMCGAWGASYRRLHGPHGRYVDYFPHRRRTLCRQCVFCTSHQTVGANGGMLCPDVCIADGRTRRKLGSTALRSIIFRRTSASLTSTHLAGRRV